MILGQLGQKLTCDWCSFGERELKVVKKGFEDKPAIICHNCYAKNYEQLQPRIESGRYSVETLK